MRVGLTASLAAAAVFAGSAARAQSIDPAPYNDRFTRLRQAIHDSANGYFSPEGVPYHSPETLIVEAPDYGHETTSEALSYWLLLEAMHGRLTGDWSPLASAWSTMERVAIPTNADQPTSAFYNAGKPATFAPEGDHPSAYPAPLDFGVAAGRDPIAAELQAAYNTTDVYGMHWILDVDNWYGYGNRGDGVSKPSYINTFQRGPQESVWETVPQPCWDAFRYGGTNGYLDLFVGDSKYARQWKYTNAPDADARAVQAIYWAWVWARERGDGTGALPVSKASRLGDYLRYALFDKYFKALGCQSRGCTPGSDRDSAHYLVSWYYAWGGATDTSSGWAWRIGESTSHFGYQNPMAAWVLSHEPAFRPASSKGASDWSESLKRQLEFYQWLQSAEGAIAGGATNSWNGRYEAFPTGTSTFHGLAYVEAPVYEDPPSNGWFGWQAWSMQRVAEYYLVTGDGVAGALLDRWVAWVKAVVQLPADGTYRIPSTLSWSGQPQTWTGTYARNADLHVTVESTTNDVGVAASLARTLIAYAAAKAHHAGGVDAATRDLAQQLLDRMWAQHRDARGLSAVEVRDDYKRMFSEVVYIPSGWSGRMPNGDAIQPGVTFLDLRSKYRQDPDFARTQAAVQAGTGPEMRYHRFWAQVEAAVANAEFARYFGEGGGGSSSSSGGTSSGSSGGASSGSSGGASSGSSSGGTSSGSSSGGASSGSSGGASSSSSGGASSGSSGGTSSGSSGGTSSSSSGGASSGSSGGGSSGGSSSGIAGGSSGGSGAPPAGDPSQNGDDTVAGGCGCGTSGPAQALSALPIVGPWLLRRRIRVRRP